MFAFSIVEHLNVFEYRLQGVLRALELLVVDQLRFDDAEKRLGHRIVPAVTFTAHALDETMLYQHLSKLLACILNTAIRVNDQPGTGTTIADAAGKSCYNHFSAQGTAQRPADHHTGEQVDKDRQVKPAMRCGDVGDIRHPHFVRPIGLKITLQKVIRDWMGMLRIGGRPVLAPNDRAKTSGFHPSGDTILADRSGTQQP